jgi:hypothetical protein
MVRSCGDKGIYDGYIIYTVDPFLPSHGDYHEISEIKDDNTRKPGTDAQ